MMQALAMNTTVGFFVEMVSQIRKSLLKFSPGYIWLILGWVTTWHILLGNPTNSSFHGVSNTLAKVFAMWTGEIGFEATFVNVTSVASYEKEK